MHGYTKQVTNGNNRNINSYHKRMKSATLDTKNLAPSIREQLCNSVKKLGRCKEAVAYPIEERPEAIRFISLLLSTYGGVRHLPLLLPVELRLGP